MTSFPLIFSGNPVLPWMYSTSGKTSCAQTLTGRATVAAVASTAATSFIFSLRPHVTCIGEEYCTSPNQADRRAAVTGFAFVVGPTPNFIPTGLACVKTASRSTRRNHLHEYLYE